MFSRISKRVVPFLNLFQMLPLFQPRPEASHDEEKVEDVNLVYLWKHIDELGKPGQKGNHKKARSLVHFPWPDDPGLQKLKEIVSLETDLPIEDIHGAIKEILGRVNVATVAPLVVAHTLERLDDILTNREKFWHLVKEMYDLAIVLKRLSESPEGTQDLMQEATSLIVEGARVFSLQGGCHRSASEKVSAIREKLNTMKKHIKRHTRIQHQRRPHLSKEYPPHADNGQVEEDLLSTGSQKVFTIGALVAATNNFHKDNKLGEGGFGAVYKGTTRDGTQIAVKKMSFTSDEGRKQFMNEKLLAEVQHRNLVNLLGSCEQESQGFLVYEYLLNKSLDKFLFDPEKRKELDWHICYKIILGTARGLCYLHEDCQKPIVHRDIKASNILLDEKLNPKIADFGTANLFPEDRTHVTATSRVGTFGYWAPEYLTTGKLSLRTDVYSFGMVVVELLTGEKISLESLERVWHSYKKKKFVPTIDPTMTRTEKAKALRCIQVGLLCIQEDLLRPTMSQVITMLSTSENLRVPKKPLIMSSTGR